MMRTETQTPRSRLYAVIAFVLALAAAALTPAAAQAAAPAGSDALLEYEDDWAETSGGTRMQRVVKAIGANDYWKAGFDGSGVDVALIDSGVLPVDSLDDPGKVINGPDLSFESQADNLRYLDSYGHGTHLAGIIAGYRPGFDDDPGFKGIAPGARLLNVKVADSNGGVDVSQVIAAIDWVVEHRTDNGMNIRVLNLAFGTDGVQPHEVDPLHFAVERAWQAGIVVVVSAGNDGNGAALRNPAADPYVIAVGATDSKDTTRTSDDVVADFSNCGTTARHVDVVAPGRSLKSLRAPGTVSDVNNPNARVNPDLFKGSGTSQAAAVVSGAAALIIEQRPAIAPDEVKALLMNTATTVSGSTLCQGAGSVDLDTALSTATPTNATQTHTPSDGTGSIDAARGTHRVVDEGVTISGEIDIFGNTFDSASWSQAVAAGASWSGGTWNGASWSGASWSGASWSGASWSGASWSGASWSGASWSSKSWSGASWSGASWSGASWSGASWSGASWSGNVWLGLSWH